MNQRIFAFHLLNDRSGSPKVLAQLLKGWLDEGFVVHLGTHSESTGFLGGIDGVKYHRIWYKYSKNPLIRLVYYTLSQLVLFFKMYRSITKNDIIYINTVLPFGAAFIGKMKGARVIYHVHESSVSPAILKWFLFKMVDLCAHDIINVSRYVQEAHALRHKRNHLVYNSIDEAFLQKVQVKNDSPKRSNVLMICSLKTYKGVWEYAHLATDNPDYQFELVLNATQAEIDDFFGGNADLPSNLKIFDAQSNLHPFFSRADIIVNLSDIDRWVETFGLTIIEGMAYGLPSIVPPAGGILEVIEEGKTGLAIDARNRQKLSDGLRYILGDAARYQQMSEAAEQRLSLFREANQISHTISILRQVSK
jgi:glycosyltransferase involved in cell wall biosynthesis